MPLIAQYLVIAYFSFAFVKFMLTMPSLPVAIATLSWLATRRKGVILARYVFLVPTFSLLSNLFWWIPTLWVERGRFFIAYRKYETMREVIEAYRAVLKTEGHL